MKLCILELDQPADAHIPEFGAYGDMFEHWLAPAFGDATFSRISLHRAGHLPALQAFDGYILTGCRHGVYDDIPWKSDLQAFLRRARDSGTPLGGVCFGHQIMADTFGADVRKSDAGWVIGKDTYAGQSAFAIHQDQVLSAPEGARSVAGSDRCPIGRIDYGFAAISIQYHPEFTPPYARAFLDDWRGNPLPIPLVDAAAARLDAPLDCDRIAADFARVLTARAAL